MKILLVNPNMAETFWSFKNALKFISKKAVTPPLGLLTIAAMLPGDWDLKLIDMSTTKLLAEDIQWADYVFISAMLIQRQSADDVIARCKKNGTKVVAGGHLFTSLPEEYTHVDHLILKEGELTLPRFLKDLENGSGKKVYDTDEKADLNETPIPLWKLINIENYVTMGIQFSRGCPFDCDFCDVTTLFGRKIRVKSTENILDELESLYSFGWRDKVFFVDDNFIGNPPHLKKELLPAIIDWMKKRDHPFTFHTQASINLADDEELMELMVEAGFNCVFVGIETPSQDCLSECNKVQNKGRDLVACIKKIHHFGMQVQGGFILGFDNDETSAFDSLIQFVQKSGVVVSMVGLLNAPRGTKLYSRLLAENRLIKIQTGDNTDFSINFIPKMKTKDLLEGYKKVVSTLYSPRAYCERVMTFLDSYKIKGNRKVKVDHSDIKAFLKSIWHLGIIDEGRVYYWKLIFLGLKRPRYFHAVVTLAIYGFHFRTIF